MQPRVCLPIRALFLAGIVAAGAAAATPKEPSAAERAASLAKQAAAFLVEGKAADAEAALLEAATLDPRNPAHFYTLACARARQDKREQAVADLERAVGLGFTNFGLIARDPHLEDLRKSARVRHLLDNKDRYLRRTAQATLAALRNRFGDAGYHYQIDDRQRLIFAVALDGPGFEQLKSGLREQSEALAAALFGQRPEAYVTVLMPTAKDYGKLVRFRNVPGLYVEQGRTLVARERGYVMVHEFTHALHAADRAPLGQQHAPWVNEGFGVLTESATFAGGEFRPKDPSRFAALPYAARRKGLIPLERLVAMEQAEFVTRPNLTYAQSGYLMLYLWEKKLLKPFYEAYKETHAKDATGRAALEQVTGMPLPELHEQWRLWLAARAKEPKR